MSPYQGGDAAERQNARERSERSIDHEKLQVLDGSRSGKTDVTRRAAVRLADLDAIIRMKHNTKAVTLTAAPTAADYNALLADMKRINQALVDVSNILAAKLVP